MTQTDVQQVFDTIIANAVKLCGARQGRCTCTTANSCTVALIANYAPEIIEILGECIRGLRSQTRSRVAAILSRAAARDRVTAHRPSMHGSAPLPTGEPPRPASAFSSSRYQDLRGVLPRSA